MSRLIDSLPGVSMDVKDVSQTLRDMWDSPVGPQGQAADYRASQLNLILHFGLKVSTDEVLEKFNEAVSFAQRYPCRIIVLCPSTAQEGFDAKLFSQCYIGKHLRDLCCCEALILGYAPDQSDFLENQVSVWLEADLPIYHWFHRVPAERIEQYYLGFIKRCQRILFDGEIEGDDYDAIPWPNKDRVSDLSYARALPLRQHIGQFISGFTREELIDGLESVSLQYTEGTRRKAFNLLHWQENALARCFPKPEDMDAVVFTFEKVDAKDATHCLQIKWTYKRREKYLEMKYNRSHKSGIIRAALPSGVFEQPLHIEPLAPANSLSEAMFFG